jgi:hypothetical protein
MMNDYRKTAEVATVHVDGYTRFCLSAIVVLLTVLIVGLWANGPVSDVSDASAAVKSPKSGSSTLNLLDARAQRVGTLKAAQKTNRQLDKIITLLKSGDIRVSIADAGKKKEEPKNARKLPKK